MKSDKVEGHEQAATQYCVSCHSSEHILDGVVFIATQYSAPAVPGRLAFNRHRVMN
jgi:hypothetical protein